MQDLIYSSSISQRLQVSSTSYSLILSVHLALPSSDDGPWLAMQSVVRAFYGHEPDEF